jgi:hypothetical protein
MSTVMAGKTICKGGLSSRSCRMAFTNHQSPLQMPFVRAAVAPTAPTVDFSAKKLKFESKYDYIV